ncbi:MAG: YihY/virulence factor BrkB family protein [Desulfobacteraceae bacterium]|nr:MAG: YihY/virulence factor BrkB family protein [Desulfobacteraceae bacterium]
MNISKALKFLKDDIWRIQERNLTRSKAFLIRQLRILVLSLKGVVEDRCQLRASALTVYSLLSIVPVFAMLFGIAKGFGFEKALERELMTRLEGQEEVLSRLINFSHTLLENTKGGVMAGVGIVLLFWAIIKVLGHIENSFNDLWGVKKGRSFGRKVADYLSIMLIGPVLFITSSTITVLISGQVEIFIQKIAILGVVAPAIFFMLKLLPYCAIWILFTFMYIFMPNTKVNFKSGALAGIVAGALFQIFQLLYISLQFGVARYNAIYGSFAALPLFLIWLQLSWLIVLFGAEISFAHQNVHTFEFEPDSLRVSNAFKRLLTLRIVHLLVKNFSDLEKSLNETQISQKLEIPIRLVRLILYELVGSGIVSEINVDRDKNVAYQPAHNTDIMTVKYVMDTLEGHGSDNIPVAKSEELERLSECLKSFGDLIERSPANVRLKDI